MPAPDSDSVLPLPPAAQAIIRRRTARRFDSSRPFDPELLTRLLRLASLAPSAYNLQPWRFLVVRSERNRLRLQACAYRNPKIAEAAVVVIVLGAHHPESSHLGEIVETQIAVGASSPEEAAELRARALQSQDRRSDHSRWATSTSMCAVATLMIAAEALGAASALIEDFDCAKLKDAFGIPDDHSVACLIALGWPSETPPDPGRLPLSALCYEEHFGQPWTLGEPSLTDAARAGSAASLGFPEDEGLR